MSECVIAIRNFNAGDNTHVIEDIWSFGSIFWFISEIYFDELNAYAYAYAYTLYHVMYILYEKL